MTDTPAGNDFTAIIRSFSHASLINKKWPFDFENAIFPRTIAYKLSIKRLGIFCNFTLAFTYIKQIFHPFFVNFTALFSFCSFFTASNFRIMYFNFVCILIEPVTKRFAVFHILITSLTVSSFKSLQYGHFFKNFW